MRAASLVALVLIAGAYLYRQRAEAATAPRPAPDVYFHPDSDIPQTEPFKE